MNETTATPESEYYNGYADGSYETDHDDAPLTDEQLTECSEAYADGYRKGYNGAPFAPEALADEPAKETAR